MSALADVYGTILAVRPPVPATVNKAGANYKSEVAHLTYAPRRAYDEWLAILDGIVACGGDAVLAFEDIDEPLLDQDALYVDGDGAIHPLGSNEILGRLDDVMTGRVFTANGPWVVRNDDGITAVMQHMLPHRVAEAPYYRNLLARIAEECELPLKIIENPHRWEGMADVAVVGDRVVLTYAVPGHYDEGLSPKSTRSSRQGVAFAADAVGVPESARIYAELVYPHFHGDTVHFGLRPANAPPQLVHYPAGLWRGESARVQEKLATPIIALDHDDAVEQYAGNSRQVADGVLVPDGVSDGYVNELQSRGLHCRRVPLFELFGKAGGGPACATLYLPRNLPLPAASPLRYRTARTTVIARRARIAESLTVSPDYFAARARG